MTMITTYDNDNDANDDDDDTNDGNFITHTSIHS